MERDLVWNLLVASIAYARLIAGGLSSEYLSFISLLFDIGTSLIVDST